jgi:hypothetical protein
MPFPFLPALFGVCFALIWMFIGGIIVRDCQRVIRHDHS